MRRCVLAISIALALWPRSSASAQAGRIGYLRASDPANLAIAREDVDLACEATSERELRCDIVARWELRNEGDEARTPEILISWGGEPSNVEVRVGEATLANEIPKLRPLRIIVPPHASTIVEMRAQQSLVNYSGTGPGADVPSPIDPHDALAARHPLVAQRWEIARRGFAWVRPSEIHWTSRGPTTIHVHPIAGWEVAPHADHAIDDRTEDGVRLFTWQPSDSDDDARGAIGVELTHGIHTDILRNGGPFIALGGTIDGGFRGRLGYEIGLGEWVLFSASLESDFAHQVVIAPLLEVATWSMLIGPSLSLGIGVPIQIAPFAQAGMRIEASATFYSVAFVAAFDYWPGDPPNDPAGAPFSPPWQLHLMGRIGL